jgi:DNA polymerase I-like protein with 3'-5' exonuclease and polymerase domains
LKITGTRFVVLDVETTTSNTGAPYDSTNKCCGVAVGIPSTNTWIFTLDKEVIQKAIDEADSIVGFNFKFDLAWLRNLGISVQRKRIYDCSIAEYLVTHQRKSYPSLNECSEKYGFGQKLDVVKTEYWDKGIDTDQIPYGILSEYAIQDIRLTWDLFNVYREIIGNKARLWELDGYDLIVIEDMERNGIEVDFVFQERKLAELQTQAEDLRQKIKKFAPDVPDFNPDSGDHVSCLLYGGTINVTRQIPVGVYKTGARAGQVKFGNETVPVHLPRRVKPLPRSELKKPGYYSTNEGTLRKLAGGGEITSLLLTYASIQTLISRYFKYGQTIREANWADKRVHSSFSQVTTNTGRLGSSKPNVQNVPEIAKPTFISRFK